MSAPLTFFQTLRMERRPLALLAMLAVGLRVTVIMIGLALSPEVAASGLGILCQPSVEDDGSVPSPAPHDPAHCICGPACIHLGLFTATPAVDAVWKVAVRTLSAKLPLAADGWRDPAILREQAPIRAPPISLS
ncbi:hypothetical protein [uncultured Roseibium sp.]|uniref:hypothetical protein n=1 Tax=uncultured Roseibium sp. TaxID=1936171 RepID=UPI003217DFE4